VSAGLTLVAGKDHKRGFCELQRWRAIVYQKTYHRAACCSVVARHTQIDNWECAPSTDRRSCLVTHVWESPSSRVTAFSESRSKTIRCFQIVRSDNCSGDGWRDADDAKLGKMDIVS
jgi:hypothetical protein